MQAPRIRGMGGAQNTSREDGRSHGHGRPLPLDRHKPANNAFLVMDAMRCVLAVVVAFAHAWYLLIENYRGQTTIAAAVGYFLSGYAHASVILFFVLSGYWIARSVDGRMNKGWHWPSYLIDRFTRLLVVLVPALAIGGTLDAMGLYVLGSSTHSGATATYVLRADIANTLGWNVLLGNLLFLQSIVVAPFGTNGPLWSLAYEFWFYIWFPAIAVSWRRRRPSLFLLAIGLVWFAPFMVVAFGCWLCGAALYRITAKRDSALAPLSLKWLAVGGVPLIVMLVVVRIVGTEGFELTLAAAFAVFLYVLLRTDPSVPGWMKPLAAYGAKASFSLYALHFPILAFLAALLLDAKRMVPSGPNIALVIGALLVAVVVCALFARGTERHTGRIRAAFGKRLAVSPSRAD